ncbi:hypothetical protein [Maribacter aquivivus]|uniref:hypothetical protein n=1 Tax=Maribacter aquivivus TaxID=228958 RepID=UPI002491919D|nr:hypothetical protein [Maribacter aquivivus]
MREYSIYFVLVLILCGFQIGNAQEEVLTNKKAQNFEEDKRVVVLEEREMLKIKIQKINADLKNKLIDQITADSLKKSAAQFHALNIENRLAIIDNEMEFSIRNEGVDTTNIILKRRRFEWGLGQKNEFGERIFGVSFKGKEDKEPVYDKRTSSDLVFALGVNSAVGGNTKFYQIIYFPGHFYEIGWAWRYRLKKENNDLRLNYGISYQRNILGFGAPSLFEADFENQGFVVDGVVIADSRDDYTISDKKLATGNIVFPVHLEMGPSKERRTESSLRYSLRGKFRFGLGGYLGLGLGLAQTIEYTGIGEYSVGVKSTAKRGGLEKNNFVYGLSCYAGIGGILLYTKLDLNTLYESERKVYRNFSLGLRFDL